MELSYKNFIFTDSTTTADTKTWRAGKLMFSTREHVFGSISAYLNVLDLSLIMMIMGKDL